MFQAVTPENAHKWCRKLAINAHRAKKVKGGRFLCWRGWKACGKQTLCTASSATPQAGYNPLQTVQNCARTVAKINVQHVLPLDKFLHVQVALCYGLHCVLAPNVGLFYLYGGMDTINLVEKEIGDHGTTPSHRW